MNSKGVIMKRLWFALMALTIMLSISATNMAAQEQRRNEMPNIREGNYIFTLSEKVARTPVTYKNRYGITLSADLYAPKNFDASRQYPAIIIGSPYGGVKEQGAGIYAQNMAERGFMALAFDPSHNGYSGGQPRHRFILLVYV